MLGVSWEKSPDVALYDELTGNLYNEMHMELELAKIESRTFDQSFL